MGLTTCCSDIHLVVNPLSLNLCLKKIDKLLCAFRAAVRPATEVGSILGFFHGGNARTEGNGLSTE